MRRLLALMALLMLTASVPLRADVTVPITEDLAVEGELAGERNLPILLMFYSEHCAYCRTVEDEFLEPMLISGDYTDRVIIRRIDLSNPGRVTDFDGQRIAMADFAARYKIRVTPTLLYVDATGREVAKKMVGLTTIDFFGGYIDRRIATALETLQAQPVRSAAREDADKRLD